MFSNSFARHRSTSLSQLNLANPRSHPPDQILGMSRYLFRLSRKWYVLDTVNSWFANRFDNSFPFLNCNFFFISPQNDHGTLIRPFFFFWQIHTLYFLNFCIYFLFSSQVPELSWTEVISCLDHPGFLISTVEALRLIVTACSKGSQDVFPIEILYRSWANTEGQVS